jgi:uncharacterized membrane protein YhaH (DUF805 family)
MVNFKEFWDLNKVWFSLVGIALTAFLSVGAVYLAWWINDGFGIIMLIILILMALAGGSSIANRYNDETRKEKTSS